LAKNQSVEVPEAVANRAVNRPRVQPQQPNRNVNASGQSDSGRSVSRSASNDRHSASPAHNFIVGQLVDCKASKDGGLYMGIVKNLQPLIIQVQGFQDGRWRFVRARELLEIVLCGNEAIYAAPDDRQASTFTINSGTKVRVLETVGEFAHIIFPVDGWMRIKQGAVVPQPIPQPKPSDDLSMIQCLVTEKMSAKDLALACERSSGTLPKKVRIQLINNRRVGVVGFEARSTAELVMNRGLVHLGQQLLIKWYPVQNAI